MYNFTAFKIIFYANIILFLVEAIKIEGSDYKVIKNVKSSLSVSKRITASTSIQCVLYCEQMYGCTKINFKKNECELLTNDPREDDELVEITGWKFICM